MKKLAIIAIIAALITPAFAQKKEAEKNEAWKSKKFTTQELKQYDGKNGNPVYVAVDGIVYDVTKSKYWKTGTHMKMHQAGADLSKEIKQQAPQRIHKGGKILEKMPKVGVLVSSQEAQTSSEKEVSSAKPEKKEEKKEVKAEKK